MLVKAQRKDALNPTLIDAVLWLPKPSVRRAEPRAALEQPGRAHAPAGGAATLPDAADVVLPLPVGMVFFCSYLIVYFLRATR